MWLDRSRGKNAYEVPKGSGNTLIYIGALWMGGMDVNNQLKIAALRYRIGNDFWAGPLSTNPGTGNISIGKLDYGPAEIDAEDCVKWDQFFITTRTEVELFNAWYECSNDPNCDASVDYPDYAHKVAKKVKLNKRNVGILVCGSGTGMVMTANKHKNVRAALCYNVKSTKLSRLHNNANVMTIGSRLIKKNVALKCVSTFLKTDFDGGRHSRRVKKI